MSDQEQLRSIDQTVLHKIQEGKTDTQKITEATTLETHQVRYSLNKLDKLELIDLEKPDGMVERIIDGQKRVFKHPTQARLTEASRQHLNTGQNETETRYENLSKDELTQKVIQLENEVDELRESLNTFKRQVRQQL